MKITGRAGASVKELGRYRLAVLTQNRSETDRH